MWRCFKTRNIYGMETVFTSDGADATEKLAEQIGARLNGGEVIELKSDLGGGKTTFVRGLARGAGSEDPVASPTFTVSKLYECPNFQIYHFDFYRLRDAGLMEHEVQDLLFDDSVVLVLEWSGAVENILPVERMVIDIQHQAENQRKIVVNCPEKFDYLMENVC